MQLLSIFRKSPFARFLIFFVAGIIAAKTFAVGIPGELPVPAGLTVLLLTLLFAIIQWYSGYNKDWIAGVLSATLLFLLGFLNGDIRNHFNRRISGIEECRGIYLFQIMEPPEIRDKVVKAIAMIQGSRVSGDWEPEHFKVMLYIVKDTAVQRIAAGDQVWADTRITNIRPPGNPLEFDYRGYMAARGIHKQAFLRQGSWKISDFRKPTPERIVFGMRNLLLDTYEKIGLDETLYGILAAVTLGYRNDLEARTKQAFSRAGVMHVMALSGFNVAIIAMALGYLMAGIGNTRSGSAGKTTVILMVIWLFAIVTGLSPSVTRASVMFSFVMTGNLFKRHINAANILFASAFVLLALSPGLIADVSFQLSFAAVWGLIVYQPALYRAFHFKNPLTERIWKLFTVTCSAQLSTLPFTLYYFHQFPVYFWLTNLFIVPLVSLIICAAFLFLLVSAIHPLAVVTGKILALFLGVLYRSVIFSEMLPGALIENIYISSQQAAALFAAILLIHMAFRYKKSGIFMMTLTVLLAFQLMGLVHNHKIRNQRVFQVGNVKGRSVLCFMAGRDCLVLGDSGLNSDQKQLKYALENFWIRRGVAGSLKFHSGDLSGEANMPRLTGLYFGRPWSGNNCCFIFSGRRIAWLQDNQVYGYCTALPLTVDMVIISGSLKPDPEALIRFVKTNLVILDSSVREFMANQWKSACRQKKIPCWDVTEGGSFWIQSGNR